MKQLLLFLSIIGCAKAADDVPTLQDHARSIEKYYTAEIDLATRRVQRIVEVSGKVQKDLPGSDEALRALVDAHDKLVEARKIRENVEKALTTLNTPDKLADLERLVEHEQHQYEEALDFINENASEVESYEANAIRNGFVVNAPTGGSAAAIPEGAIP